MELLSRSKVKQPVQMGTTIFHPWEVIFEFIFPDPIGGALVFSVEVAVGERIVLLPVPSWVVENIWQGSVDGSFHFETAARGLVAKFSGLLDAEENRKLFGPQMAKRRE